MNAIDVEHLRQIKTLPSLIKFLRDELDWPVEADGVDELTFEYTPAELGLDAKYAEAVKEVRQIRRLDTRQPWGIFWVNFDKKRLPMVVLRRILGNLVVKKRPGMQRGDRPSWHLHDLLLISSYGEEEHRTITFAHFTEDPNTDELPVLRVLGWDDQNSIMELDRVANRLRSHFRWPDNPQEVDAWRKRWSEAFTDRYREAIRSADELIPRLAKLAGDIRSRVRDVLTAETERGPMRRLFAAVREMLIHDMTEDGFGDMYAQTVAYGLLSARFSRSEGLTAQNLVQLTAISNPFLENLLENLFRLNRGKFHFDIDEVGINDVLDLLRNTNIEAIKAAFNDLNPAEDPVIRFYEGFLKAYDPHQRVKRGVFFTPRPVVSYIVHSVHELLQTEFGLEDGLASTATWADMLRKFPDLQAPKGVKPAEPFVTVLDPAVGTATFLNECIEVIERTMKTKWARAIGTREPESPGTWRNPQILGQWRGYVSKYLLPRLYGFEIMMAPYAIAHMKLALKLSETGYRFQDGDRLHIYLTNTLEPPSDIADAKLADLFGPLAREAQEVNRIKHTRGFTVVIGNPPYAGHSANRSRDTDGNITFIGGLIERYKIVDGKPLGERQPKWLQDDYVKFIRFAQWCLDNTSCGQLGFITNHSYADNPTFRGVRQSLLASFDAIYINDLHGNSNKSEVAPDGSPDENVFDIQQGVAILLCSKFPKNRDRRIVSRHDLLGSRSSKYDVLSTQSVTGMEWDALEAVGPSYLFIRQDTELAAEYQKGWRITDVFPANNVGFVTARDAFVIDFEQLALRQRIAELRAPARQIPTPQIQQRYGLGNTTSWNLEEARELLRRNSDWEGFFRKCLYRPFDIRHIYYSPDMLERPVFQIQRHMLSGRNIGLL